MSQYTGPRDPRFVRIHRGGLLTEADHRLLAAWAADCAEHVLPLFTSRYPEDDRPRRSIETARMWSRGETTVGEARKAAYAAHAAARSVSDAAAVLAARAAGHAAATAHMADHALGPAYYAIKAVRLAADPSDTITAGASAAITAGASAATAADEHECRWQLEKLPDEISELVRSDQERRNAKFGSVFTC